MDLDQLVDIVETMALQHSYPGFDIRSLQLGLPDAVTKSPARLFVAALKHENPVVKLAALRWFWERPGDARKHARQIGEVLEDPDEWVRLEAVRALGRLESLEEKIAIEVAKRLADENAEVRKAAAKSCGK